MHRYINQQCFLVCGCVHVWVWASECVCVFDAKCIWKWGWEAAIMPPKAGHSQPPRVPKTQGHTSLRYLCPSGKGGRPQMVHRQPKDGSPRGNGQLTLQKPICWEQSKPPMTKNNHAKTSSQNQQVPASQGGASPRPKPTQPVVKVYDSTVPGLRAWQKNLYLDI